MIKIDNKEVFIQKFPNGEFRLPVKYETGIKKVFFKWYNDEDWLHLYFVLSYLKELECKIILTISYMPYSRMDRSEDGSCFTLKYACEMLSSILDENDKINIVQPHSKVCMDLLKAKMLNVEEIDVISKLYENLKKYIQVDFVCYPDKGAKERFSLNIDKPVIFCEKKRDFSTGRLLGLDLISDYDLKDKNVLILDDLCSRGGTFELVATKLKEKGVKDIYLGLCHIEDAIKQGSLLIKIKNFDEEDDSLIKYIFGMNSMIFDTNSLLVGFKNIAIFDIETFLNEGKFIRACFDEALYW